MPHLASLDPLLKRRSHVSIRHLRDSCLYIYICANDYYEVEYTTWTSSIIILFEHLPLQIHRCYTGRAVTTFTSREMITSLQFVSDSCITFTSKSLNRTSRQKSILVWWIEGKSSGNHVDHKQQGHTNKCSMSSAVAIDDELGNHDISKSAARPYNDKKECIANSQLRQKVRGIRRWEDYSKYLV